MEERKFIRLKKEEFGIKEYIKRNLGKGKISRLDIEYTPIGEKIIISTSKPGLVIGRKGEKIEELTRILKTRFKLENPHIEVKEIKNPLFDAQLVADEIAMALERMGNLKFKVISYRKLQEIMNAGALGCELRVSGKLPSERAKSWRFAQGYLKKAGESRKEVNRAQATAVTKTGMIGVKVAIMAPDAKIYDKIDIDDAFRVKLKKIWGVEKEEEKPEKKVRKKIEKNRSNIKKNKKEVKKKTDNTNQDKESKVQVSESSLSSESLRDINKKDLEDNKETDEKEKLKEEIKEFEESKEVPSEEDGTAMKIEEEIKEGVPQEVIDKELKDIEKHEEKKITKAKEKTNKGKEPNKEEI